MNTPEKKKGKKTVLIIVAVCAVLAVALAAWINSLPGPEESTTSAPAAAATSVPARKEATGKSNKNIADYATSIITDSFPDDKSKKRILARVATTNGNFEEYAKSYYENYFNKIKNDTAPEISETHYIVNFTNKTVMHVINVPGADCLEVDVTEYTDKEELSVETIGEGMPLEKFFVYLDNGDIEKVNLVEE